MATAEGGGNIIRNGLVLYLDAANKKSIVNGETVWKDIEKFPAYDVNFINDTQFQDINSGSIRFDGTDDYAVRPYTSGDLYDINITGEITIDVWVRFDDVLDPEGSIISFGRPYGNNSAGHYQWELMKLNTNYPSAGGECKIVFAVSNLTQITRVNLNTNDGIFNPVNSLPPQDNTWFNLTFTYKTSTDELIAYYNSENAGGDYLNNITTTPQIPAVAYQDLNIGAASDLAGAFAMRGNIASIKIYNRVLTPQEISENYNFLKSRFSFQADSSNNQYVEDGYIDDYFE